MAHKILVVEDSPTQAERVRLLLEGEGYRVELARNGREGLQRVQAAPPDLIISDVVMPEMDGYALCQAVKSVEATRQLPFVLLTDRNTPADILLGFERGADNFITKPFEDAYLLERVQRICESLELRQQGHPETEIPVRVDGRDIAISADKQQIIELLLATFAELRATYEKQEKTNKELLLLTSVLEDRVAQRTLELRDANAQLQRELEERKRAEEELQQQREALHQSEKVATMGQLLAGVSHELNNPLSVVLGQAALLYELHPSPVITARTQKIIRAAERCARIVKNFLALARQRPSERQAVQLNQVVQEAVELLAYQLRVDDVEICLRLADDLPALWADRHQLHQVVVNLISNAQQAMHNTPVPRRLTITTWSDPVLVQVAIEVADTGPGVPPALQQRIFEPFFTTKPLGVGTGLGLSLCHGMVIAHGGTIRVDDRPGAGAVFVVNLPMSTAPGAIPAVFTLETLAALARKKILVVDDEPEIAELLREMLSVDGHQVEIATNGVIALEKLREQTYDLIMSDLRMPLLDGPGLYRELEQHDPELCRRFICITGDTLSLELQTFLERAAVPTMNKPFAWEEVRQVVQRVLQTGGETRE